METLQVIENVESVMLARSLPFVRPMITMRRANERHHSRRHSRDQWFTFYPQDRTEALADGFGVLEALNEDRLPPGAGMDLGLRQHGGLRAEPFNQ